MDDLDIWLQAAQVANQGIGNWNDVLADIRANETNLAINENTNKTNREIAQETNAANRALWLEQAEYNSPAAQVARLCAAGFSPVAALGSSGFNSSMTPNPNQQVGNPMQPGHVEPVYSRSEKLNTALQSAAQVNSNVKLNSAIERLNLAKSMVEIPKAMSEVERNKRAGILDSKTAEKMEQDIKFMDTVWNARQVKEEKEAYKISEEANKANEEALLAKIERQIQEDYGPKLAKQKLSNLNAEFKYLNEQASYFKEKQLSERAFRAEIRETARKLRLEGDQLEIFNEYWENVIGNKTDAENAQYRVDRQRASLQYTFDGAHYMDMLYNDYYKSNYSVEQARLLQSELKEQINLLRKENQFKVAKELTGLYNSVTSGINNAAGAQLRQADVRRINNDMDLARKRFDLSTKPQIHERYAPNGDPEGYIIHRYGD